MKLYISDLMDDFYPDEIELEQPPFTADRVLEIMRAQSENENVSPVRETRKRQGLSRAARIVLIAAVFMLALSVTAYAVYQAHIRDYILEESNEHYRGSRISLVGYQSSPEYQAYLEWSAYLGAVYWDFPAAVDETEDEAADAVYRLYGVSGQEAAEKLDAIVAKYGLTLHQHEGHFETVDELYAALGTEEFVGASFTPVYGYVYDDGSFQLDSLLPWGRPDNQTLASMLVSCKGSFIMTEDSIDLSEYEEWEYTTGGVTVDMVLASTSSYILLETEGAYVSVRVDAGSRVPTFEEFTNLKEAREGFFAVMGMAYPDWTEDQLEAAWQENYDVMYQSYLAILPPVIGRADLEALADDIDFAVLTKRFDGRSHPETAQAVAEMQDAYEAAREEQEAIWAEQVAEQEAQFAQVLEDIGSYGFAGQDSATVFGHGQGSSHTLWSSERLSSTVTRFYILDEYVAVSLNYWRFEPGEDGTAAQAELEAARDWYMELGEVTDCQVNGDPAFYFAETETDKDTFMGEALIWADSDSGMLFSIDVQTTGVYALEDLIALAESVTEM